MIKVKELYPNLYVVGTPKAGTTSLHDNLSLIKTIQSPIEKEPHYFSQIGNNVPSVRSLSKNEYLSMYDFESNGVKYWLDSSVSYLYQGRALDGIAKQAISPRVIIMLREPVSRMYSHWLMDYREGVTKLDFRNAVLMDYKKTDKGFGFNHMYVECSLYYEAVLNCYSYFGKDNVYVGFFEDFIKDGNIFMDNLLQWLEIDEKWNDKPLLVSNPAAVPKNILYSTLLHNFALRKFFKSILPPSTRHKIRAQFLKPAVKMNIDESDRHYFERWFSDDIEKLSGLISWDYSRWVGK